MVVWLACLDFIPEANYLLLMQDLIVFLESYLGTSIELLISGVALMISLLSLSISWRQSSTAKGTYEVTLRESNEKSLEIEAYLIEGVRWHTIKEKQLYVSFAISFVNKASAPNSISRADLEITCAYSTGKPTKIILPSENPIEPIPWFSALENIVGPIDVAAKSTVEGCLSYRVPETVVQNGNILKYRFVGKTANAQLIGFEALFLKEVFHDQ
jgi:hypothetical protein